MFRDLRKKREFFRDDSDYQKCQNLWVYLKSIDKFSFEFNALQVVATALGASTVRKSSPTWEQPKLNQVTGQKNIFYLDSPFSTEPYGAFLSTKKSSSFNFQSFRWWIEHHFPEFLEVYMYLNFWKFLTGNFYFIWRSSQNFQHFLLIGTRSKFDSHTFLCSEVVIILLKTYSYKLTDYM